ncbi:MAG: hypothetical protein SAJ12_10590 [Jaaginema sp. PMC 1079.18]|nr:hypothetical protein [Jaaginema sp. PMC 1080.18]MEC4851449.1 hypothetical protein [Jaaginema sp. PMC 1079.18]MEC4868248.1 hypothetical protein [Jaaginema sp. PMC 1078.18]
MRKKLDFSLLVLTSFVVVMGVSSVQQKWSDRVLASEVSASVYPMAARAWDVIPPLSERSCPVIPFS